VVAGIDFYNVEAEAYGAVVQDAGGIAVPFIASTPFRHVSELLGLKPIDPATDGRFPLVFESAMRLRTACPGAVVAVPLSGPFSIAQNLLGMEEILVGALSDPEVVREVLLVIARHLGSVIEKALALGLEVIVFESSASPPLLSPSLFRTAEVPALAHLGAVHRKAAGRGIAFILGGNTVPVLDDIIQAGAGSIICPAEVDGEAFFRKMRAHPGVAVRINMRPGVFARSYEEAVAEAASALALAAGKDNVCIGSGVLPYDAIPDIVRRIQSYIEGHQR
jgi:uroporphyrinogen decarboxylase